MSNNNLELTLLQEAQTNKEVTVNTAILAVSDAITETLAVALVSNDATIAAADFLGNYNFVLSGATAAATVELPALKKTSRFKNTTTFAITLKVGTGSYVLAAGTANIIYTDGTANGIERSSTAAAALPSGGTTGQVLTKNSGADGDVGWATPSSDGGGGGGGGGGGSSTSNGIPTTNGLRLGFVPGEGYYAFSLVEVVMQDASGTVIAWPSGTTFSASDTDSASSAANAADGNTGTFWSSANFGGGAQAGRSVWWEARFPSGTNIEIGSVQVTARGSSAGPQTPATIQWYVSDGAAWKLHKQTTRDTPSTDNEVRTIPLLVSLAANKPWYWNPPTSATLTQALVANTGSGAITFGVEDDADAGYIMRASLAGTQNGGNAHRAQGVAKPSGNWTVTAHILPQIFHGSNNGTAGIGFWAGSSPTNMITFCLRENDALAAVKWPLNTGYDGTNFSVVYPPTYDWLRVHYDATANVATFFVSNNGKLFTKIATYSNFIGDYLSAIDYIGLAVNWNSTADQGDVGLVCDYFNLVNA